MKNARREQFKARLFGLTDASVEFRNSQRSIAFVAVWLGLSLLTLLLTFFFVNDNLHRALVIGYSFLKYIPLIGVVYNLSKRMAALYLDDIYELNNENLAADFLEEVTFGYGREKITVKEGKIPDKDETSPIILIGGPGKIQVNLDNVALLEKVDGEPEVIFPRNEAWTLGRFERIREIGNSDEVGKREYAIINLRDQFISGLLVKSRTKDGIRIEAQGIKVIFSILRKPNTESDHDENDAYFFDEKAVQALVYNQTIGTMDQWAASGVPFPWDTTIVPLILSEMESLITSRTLSEILATISQKEMDQASNNDQTIAQMRVEMTGAQASPTSAKKEVTPPKFESRSKITSQFFSPEFKVKAAKLGVEIEWIDVGTWQLPNNMILDKHKDAWNLTLENEKKRREVERSKKKHEMDELMQLVTSVVIENFDNFDNYNKNSMRRKSSNRELKDLEQLIAARPDIVDPALARQFILDQASDKKDAHAIAVEILKAFRKELLAGRESIRIDTRPIQQKQADIECIDKALRDISHLTFHYIKNP